MENGRILDEPVFDHTHEAEILKAENKAFGVKEEAEKPAPKTEADNAPNKKEKKKPASSPRSNALFASSSPRNPPAGKSSSAPRASKHASAS